MVVGEPRDMRPLMAQCHFGLGKLCLRTGKRALAYKHLRAATAMYRDMDMQFWLGQAETELRQLK
jgi:hypothetical protein